MRHLVAILVTVAIVHATIQWETTSISVGSDAGWGRLLPNLHGSTSLLTYSQYKHPLPNGCVRSYLLPGPEIWVLESDDGFRSSRNISWIPSPANHIQEQSMMISVPNSDRLLLIMRNRQPDCNWFGLPIVSSDDNGKTWQFLSQLDQTTKATGRFDRGLWEPFLFPLSDNCIAGFYADETRADEGWNQIIAQRISCDGGKVWGPQIIAAGLKDGKSRAGMPGVARMSNGKIMLVFEVCGTDDCNIHFKISSHGTNWPTGLGNRIADQKNGPYVQVLSDGRILVTSACTNAISVSTDQGSTWSLNNPPAWNAQCAKNDPMTWPAIYNVSDHIGVVVSGLSPNIEIRYSK